MRWAVGLGRPRLGVAVLWLCLGWLACGPRGPSASDVDRSIREFQLAATLRQEGRIPGAIEHLRKSIEHDPDNAEAHLLLGYIQMERQRFEIAEKHLKQGVELLRAQERHGATLAEALNMLGLTRIHLGHFQSASQVLKESANHELNTAPHLAWGNLGLAQLKKGDHAAALQALGKSVRIQPRFCLGYYTMGRVYFAKKDFESAEKALVKALEADESCRQAPHFQEAWRLRGETRARLGHREDAMADFERCVELGSETSDGRACQRFLDGAGNR